MLFSLALNNKMLDIVYYMYTAHHQLLLGTVEGFIRHVFQIRKLMLRKTNDLSKII